MEFYILNMLVIPTYFATFISHLCLMKRNVYISRGREHICILNLPTIEPRLKLFDLYYKAVNFT